MLRFSLARMPIAQTLRLARPAVAVLVLMLTGGCAKLVYDSAQNSRRLQCQRIEESSARGKCLADASMSYGEYQRQSEAAKTR